MDDAPGRGDDDSGGETTTFHRVASAVLESRKPHTAERIAEKARVSEHVARQHLEELASVKLVLVDADSAARRYVPDPGYLWYRQVRALARNHDRDELELFATSFSGSIEQYQDLAGFDTFEDLRDGIEGNEVTDEERIKRQRVAADWMSDKHRLALMEDAIQWYDVLTADPQSMDRNSEL